MRILLLVDCFIPTTKAGGKLVHDLGVEFASRGHDVTVLTPSPSINSPVEVSNESGLRVIRVRMGRIKGAPKPVRAIQELRLSSVLWRKARPHLVSQPADLIVFYAPTIFWAPLVKRLKLLWSCPAYLILRDIFPQWAVDIGILRRGLVWRYFRRCEIAQYAAADVIAVQSQGDLKYFSANFPSKNYPVEVLQNWTAIQEIRASSPAYRDRLKLSGKVIFVYAGNMGVAQDMDNLLRLAKNVAAHPLIHFLFVGEGSEVPRLKSAVAANRITNVEIFPPLGQRDFLDLISECDVGLLSLDRRLKTQNVPGKLLSYLLGSLPSLASVNPESELFDLLGGAGSGFCFLNGDDAKLSEAAIRLAYDRPLRERMGKIAHQQLRTCFSVESAADKILKKFTAASVESASSGAPVFESESAYHATP